jgi:hypothetical protein
VETLLVECLCCGEQHELKRTPARLVQQGECPRCGYVGWAEVSEVDERLRRALRERPVETRRIQIAT